MSQPGPIRIMVVDDHAIVRRGLAALVNSEPDMSVVAEAEDGRQAVEFFRKCQPDVVLMDLRLPIMSGVEAITAIRAEFPQSRIIVLTTYDGDQDIHRALAAGARSYLLKDMRDAEFVATIRAVHNGARPLPATVASKLAEHFSGHDLTEMEVKVLELIVAGRKNSEIAKTLNIKDGTVKSHINRVFSKLGVTNSREAVNVALRRGIVHLE
jgi:two-component system NarL family response regulator